MESGPGDLDTCAYVYAWIHVHNPVDDHQIDQQHYHMGSELEKWQKREGYQTSIQENIQTPVRTWRGPKNYKEWPKAINSYRGQQQLNEFWLGPEWCELSSKRSIYMHDGLTLIFFRIATLHLDFSDSNSV